MFINQTACDQCNAIISGKNKNEEVHKDHIYLKGSVALETWNVKDRVWDYEYLTSSLETVQHFCRADCLTAWLLARSHYKAQTTLNPPASPEEKGQDAAFGELLPPIKKYEAPINASLKRGPGRPRKILTVSESL